MAERINQQFAQTTLERHFETEKEFCDYIELNMSMFCEEDLGVRLSAYKREFPINLDFRAGKYGRRVDFFLNTRCGQNIIVECKCLHNVSELPKAVGQLLSYRSQLRRRGVQIDRVALLNTRFCAITAEMIAEFALPIEFICMDKNHCITIS